MRPLFSHRSFMAPTTANSVSDSPNTNSVTNITCDTTKGLPRKVFAFEFRVLMDERKIGIKVPKISVKKTQRQESVRGDKSLAMIKGDWIRSGKLLQGKVSSVISGVFGHKKTQRHGGCDQRDDSRKKTSDKNPSKVVESLREIKRVSSSILILGHALRNRRRNSGEIKDHTRKHVNGEDRICKEEELCKKRILMGGKCKPLNQSGKLQYDGDGVLLPEPCSSPSSSS